MAVAAATTEPNNLYGSGRLNALQAVVLATQPMSFTLALVDEAGQPLTGTVATLTGLVSGEVFTATTVSADLATWAAVHYGAFDLAVVDSEGETHHRTVLVGMLRRQLWWPMILGS